MVDLIIAGCDLAICSLRSLLSCLVQAGHGLDVAKGYLFFLQIFCTYVVMVCRGDGSRTKILMTLVRYTVLSDQALFLMPFQTCEIFFSVASYIDHI